MGFAGLRPGGGRSVVDWFSLAGRPRADAGPAVKLLSYPSVEVSRGGGGWVPGWTCFAACDEDAQALGASGVGMALTEGMGLLVRDGWVIAEAEPQSSERRREGLWRAELHAAMRAAESAAACLRGAGGPSSRPSL